MADTVKTIGSTGDYADPILWAAGQGAVNDGNRQVGELISDVTMSGLFRPNQAFPNGGLLRGDTTVTGKIGDGRTLGNTAGSRLCLAPTDGFNFQDIEFDKGTNTYIIQNSGNTTLTRCLMPDGKFLYTADKTLTLNNCVIKDIDGLVSATQGNVVLNNTTMIDRMIIRAETLLTVLNSNSVAVDWLLGRGTYTNSETLVNYCYIKQNAPAGEFGTGSSDYTVNNDTTLEMVNFAGGDYRIKSTSSLATAGSGGTFIGAFLEAGGSGISVTALLNSNYMIEYNMKKNVASQSIGAQMITIADGSNFTGSVAVEVTIDGGTKTTGGGSVTHEGEGYHSYALTQAETNGNHIAVSFAGTGALTQTIQVYTAFPQTVDNNTKIALIPTTAMRGTDSANTVVPPSVAQFNARTIVSADYFLVADYTAPDNTSITSILADTNELQTNQGNWLTATGFSTSVEVAALNDISVTDILTTQMTESYAGDGTAPTLAQSLFLTMQNLQDFSYTGTTQTVKKLDGSTTAATYTLNDAVTPTSKTRVS